jgi:hypothetical protein
MNSLSKTVVWLFVFSVAMGFLETSVVVYLRMLYYPSGFAFPLQPIHPQIALIEFLREAATIIMLLGAGVLAGKNFPQRLAGFLFSFAVWDITYYVFLKLLLDWPASLFTWDILFLIPVPWVGPVIAPCLVAVCMIWLALLLWKSDHRFGRLPATSPDWLLLVTGCSLILVTFMQDYVSQAITTSNYWSPGNGRALFSEIQDYVPQEYNWLLYLTGLSLLVLGLGLITNRLRTARMVKTRVQVFAKQLN